MLRILILADDLSGAADCGVACAEAGLDTFVLLHPEGAGGDAEALAVDLDSRHLRAADARAVTRRAVKRLLTPDSLLYVKIDSTLRGSPGALIAGAREALAAGVRGRALALVCPAFPATGRTVRGGRVLVHGVPLERTETWAREGRCADDPHIPALLTAAGLPTRAVPVAAVRAEGLAGMLEQAVAEGAEAVVCDAETDADLARIAAAGSALGPVSGPAAIVWAGSAGLARRLAAIEATAAGADRQSLTSAVPTRRRGPVLVVVGSMSAVARAQALALAARPGGLSVAVAAGTLLAGAGSPLWAAAERSLAEALDAAGDDGVVVVSVEPDGSVRDDGVPRQALCPALARLAAPCLRRVGSVIATGGETARAVFGLAGITGIRLVGEIEPGVPMGVAAGLPEMLPLPVVTKAGAFGDPGTLVRCAEALRAGLPPGPPRAIQDAGPRSAGGMATGKGEGG